MFFDYQFDCAQRHTDHGIADVGTRVFRTASPGSPQSQNPIVFDSGDYPKSTSTVGTIPLVCTPTINNIAVSKTLIDGGAGDEAGTRQIPGSSAPG